MTSESPPDSLKSPDPRFQTAVKGLRWDEDFLKLELQDWDADSFVPGSIRSSNLAAESHSNQDDTTSLPDEQVEPERKRLRGELRSRSEHAFGQARSLQSKEGRRSTRARSAQRPSRSPKNISSDSGGDSRGLRPSSRQKGFYAEHFEKPDPVTAAKNKASRERLRRERLNESFVELTRALDPEKYVRAEKTTVIAETIKILNNIRLENEQLREEKKGLKERISATEREKDTLLFQQSLLKQELETAQAANYSQQHARSYQHSSGPIVAMGVPLNDMHGHKHHTGGLTHLMQAHASGQSSSLAHESLQPPSLQLQQHDIHPPPGDSSHAMSEAFLLPSPPDFLDMDLNHEIAALAAGNLPPPSSTSAHWLGPRTTTEEL